MENSNNTETEWFLQLDNETYSDWVSRMLVLRRIEKDLLEMLGSGYGKIIRHVHFDKFKGRYYLSNIVNSLLNMSVVIENNILISIGFVSELEWNPNKQFIELIFDYKIE